MDLLATGAGLVGGALAAQGALRLREHRTVPAGLADLLGWGFLVDEGVVLQKDGSLMAGFSYAGPDVSAATVGELESLGRQVNDAILPFADRWLFHFDAIRTPAAAYPRSVFPDPVTQRIDDERRAAHEAVERRQFETRYALIATYLPLPETYSLLTRWFVQGAEGRGVDWSGVLDEFRTHLDTISQRLSGRITIERLDSSSIVTHLHQCLTGATHRVNPPERGSYLNLALCDQDLIGGFEPVIGGQHIRAVAVHGYPAASRVGALDALNAVPYAFRWSSRILPLERETAARIIRRYELTWYKKRKSVSAWLREAVTTGSGEAGRTADETVFVDQDARSMALDAGRALADNSSGAVRFCYFTQVMVVMERDRSRADEVARELLKVVYDAGYTGRIETVNALEAFLGTLPGNGQANLRRPLVSSRNIADLLPVTGVWPGHSSNPSPLFPPGSPPLMWAVAPGATPFRVNIHDSDVGHTLVLGKTGSGKSILLALMCAQFRRYPRSQVFAFDVGYSMWLMTKAIGGSHYDIADGKPDVLKFQPLAQIDDPTERSWATDWLEQLLILQGVVVTPLQRVRIARAVELLAGNDREHRTLSELTAHLQQIDLVTALQPYTAAGNHGELLDANHDDLTDGAFSVFEIKHLMELDDRIAAPVLLYLFRRIEQRLDGRPTMIVIDEAWVALMHARFGPRIVQWLVTLRKSNAAVVLATQNVAQIATLAGRNAIMDSCPTRIYLPNSDAGSAAIGDLYRELGLNGREVATIVAATPKRHYYMKTPRGSRLFELEIGRLAMAILAPPPGATLEEARAKAMHLMDENGDAWLAQWLAECGITASSGAPRGTGREVIRSTS